MPNAITLLFKEARNAFPPFKGKPTDNNLLSIREMLLPILMEIPYDQLGGGHSLTALLTALLTDSAMYAANREAALTIWRLKTALNNLALVAMNDTAILQQLMVANLALTTTVTMFTATNKKLVDATASVRPPKYVCTREATYLAKQAVGN